MTCNNPPRTALNRAECLALLASAPVGRIAYQTENTSTWQPVNYHLDGESIIVYTTYASALIAGYHHDVALEISALTSGGPTNWTIFVTGPASAITDPADLAHLAGLPLKVLPLDSAVPNGNGSYVRIACARLTGHQNQADRKLPNDHGISGQSPSEQVNSVIGLLYHAGLDLASIRQTENAYFKAHAEAAASTLDDAIHALRLLVSTTLATDPGMVRSPRHRHAVERRSGR
jgi:hypothetical protein